MFFVCVTVSLDHCWVTEEYWKECDGVESTVSIECTQYSVLSTQCTVGTECNVRVLKEVFCDCV